MDDKELNEITDDAIRAFLKKKTFLGVKLDVDVMVPSIRKASKLCLLCKTKNTSVLGIFSPNNAVEFGGIPGKDRLIFYGLCEPCYERPNSCEEAEVVIQKGFLDL